ncbi:hypothetical protein Ddye_023604 [Dipteronia dyeriana]|uniref:Transposase n=1 Tax=Dipteronia dyeriana TaxID=168575 RepID=A0AAD9TTW7_9ROSI|nr:hypothetical protein Ddye_023604 [Dipteronia dyeriana]
MVILHEYPLSMVEHLGFHRFMGTAQPLFKIPSRNTLKSDILQIYDYERAKLKSLLEKNKGRIALTTDMWTSHNQRKGFMAITAHFVDDSWTLQSRIIRFIYVPCPHTYEMLADVMMECLHDWIIEHKLSTLTVDNCSTNNAMIHFPRLKHKYSHYKNVPTEDDWVLEKEISDELDVFYQATEEFSGTKHPTTNNYLSTVCDIRDAINEWSTSTFEQIKLMASSMANKFDSYWSNFHGIMVVATILDRIYKMKVMECYFPSLYGDESSYEINKIQEVLLRMVGEYEQKSKASLKQVKLHQTELEYYLEEPIIPRVENFDILTWWKVNASKYPTLHCIARDILAIHVSTVASNSAFSTGGRFVSSHRSRLHPKTVEALMCAQSWLWSEFNDSKLERKFEASNFGEDDD